MKFHLLSTLLLTLLMAGCASAEPISQPAGKHPLRILTLGDSITAIFRYQPFLRATLRQEGVDAIFVGAEGRDDNKHEGHSGWSIGQIEEKTAQYISDSNASVVLLQIGVNNINHGLGQKGKRFPSYQEDVYGQGAQAGKTLDDLGTTWGDKTYGTGPDFTWGTEAQQSGDWVHPRSDASAWKGMAANFAAALRRLKK